jgi:hypothetical protein
MCRNRCAYPIVPVHAVALVTAAAWVYAFAAERHAQRLLETTYLQPTPEFRASLAAAVADDSDDLHLARGR